MPPGFDAIVEFAVLVHFRYEEQLKERESQLQKEDLSDMVAEHAAKQKVSVTIPFLSATKNTGNNKQ